MTLRSRDPLVDAVRGLALMMIFVNHLPGNPLESFTSRNFGFSDATELFVFLAGYSAATAYGRRAETAGWARTGLRIWGRAFKLYVLHLFTMLLAIAIVAGASLWSEDLHFLEWINLGEMFSDPAPALLGMVLMSYQAGYFNILPLYVLLLLAAPLLLAGLRRAPAATLAASALVFLAAQFTGLNLPAYPGDGAWFFNPLTWQLMFAIGACLGDRSRRGLVPIAHHAGLFWAAAAVLLAALGMKLAGYYPSPDDLPIPFFLYGQDKTFVTVPRLLHALALLYVGSQLGTRLLLARSGPVGGCLEALGRHGLPVFCAGSVLAIAAQALLFILDAGPAAEYAIVFGGIALQIGLACFLDWYSGQSATALSLSRWRSQWRSMPQ